MKIYLLGQDFCYMFQGRPFGHTTMEKVNDDDGRRTTAGDDGNRRTTDDDDGRRRTTTNDGRRWTTTNGRQTMTTTFLFFIMIFIGLIMIH